MDRYYSQRPQPVWRQSFMQTAVGRIIIANVVILLVQWLFPAFTRTFGLVPRMVVENFYIWQLGTYMFLHGGFMHLFFNMLMLLIFGSTIESVWGARHFTIYYVVCGIGGGLLSLVFNYNSIVVGASGAIFGLYLAYAMMFPDNYIYLYFVFPVKAKYLVAGIAAFQLISGITGGAGIAYFAHLGGMIAGLFFFRDTLMQRMRFAMGPQKRWRNYMSDRKEQSERQEEDNIDSILDKINAKGYENLSPTEKRILDNYSRKRRENGE